MRRRMVRQFVQAMLVAGGVPLSLTAQAPDQGTITGRAVEATTQRPLSDVQVSVVGTQRGAITNEQGEYRIANLTPGTVTVRAQRIGYAPVTQSVTVTAGGTATANFVLSATAIQIDEVVVTATGESQRKRETGNTVATVTPSAERLATTTNIAEVLQASAPGVYVNSPGGTQGSANRIRIRGASSLSLSNEPTACTLDAQTRGVCTPKPDSLVSHNPLEVANPFITGKTSSVGASVSGGGDVAAYFVSADYDDDNGVVEPNSFRRWSTRVNLTGQFRENVSAQLSTSYVGSRGFDPSTLQYMQQKYPARASVVTIADGVEARLIEAEAALRAGDANGALAILNALRSNDELFDVR